MDTQAGKGDWACPAKGMWPESSLVTSLNPALNHMFDHIGIFVSDPLRSIPFYERCLAPLGIHIVQRQPELDAVIFSGASDFPFLWVGAACGDYHGTPLSPGVHRPLHFAFIAPSTEAVDEFYAAGIEHGGRDNGAPEDCGDGYYAAYLIDPDGNNIEAGIRQ
jgi:catechol 2,3-dioxygenase-like lactoylglutathione lyase family enzyme